MSAGGLDFVGPRPRLADGTRSNLLTGCSVNFDHRRPDWFDFREAHGCLDAGWGVPSGGLATARYGNDDVLIGVVRRGA